MRRGSVHGLLILVAACALPGLAGCSRGNAVAADEAKPAAPARNEGVSALGRIEPENGVILVGAPSTPDAVSGAVLRKLLVDEGDDVQEGQVLAETDTAELQRASLLVAKAELALAQRQAETAASEVQDACTRADVAGRTSARRNDLLKKGLSSKEESDVAAGDAKALSGSCGAARTAANAAQANVEVASARQARAEIALERTNIRAPMSGRVLEVLRRPGELVQAEGVLELGKVSRMYAVAEIYETDVRRVRVGQKATVTSPALDGALSGTVEHVRPKVRKQDATGTDPAARKDARIVEVEVLLDQPEKVAALTYLQVEVLIKP